MDDKPSTLAAVVAEMVERGVLDSWAPAYGVALAAIAVGYAGLTTAQRRLFDRDVAPALACNSPVAATPTAASSRRSDIAPLATQTAPWRPIREAPADRAIELAVAVGGGPSALIFACRKYGSTWVNAASGRPVHIQPTHWREWSKGQPGDPVR